MNTELLNILGRDATILLGNGLNNYIKKIKNDFSIPSWSDLVAELADSIKCDDIAQMFCNDDTTAKKGIKADLGISYPEIFTTLTYKTNENLHQAVAKIFQSMSGTKYHSQFCLTMKKLNHPIITTNYDRLLEISLPNNEMEWVSSIGKKRYPIDRCYRPKTIKNNDIQSFAIWHINGVDTFPESMRLGYVDYCNYISHLSRNYSSLKNIDSSLFEKEPSFKETLFYPMFTQKLVIMGLQLNRDEIVLRWLLNRRQKYWTATHSDSDKMSGWYFHCKKDGELLAGMKVFLESVGIEVITFEDYSDIYEPLVGGNLLTHK